VDFGWGHVESRLDPNDFVTESPWAGTWTL